MDAKKFTSQVLKINSIEKTILSVLFIGTILFATVNVIFVLQKMGINATTPEINNIIKAVRNGSTLSRAFALVLGVAIPGWLAALATSLFLTSA